jgi:hypothetical protein
MAERVDERPRDDAVAFLAELIRLQREVHQVGQQLDRIEAEMRQAINELDCERFKEYR